MYCCGIALLMRELEKGITTPFASEVAGVDPVSGPAQDRVGTVSAGGGREKVGEACCCR